MNQEGSGVKRSRALAAHVAEARTPRDRKTAAASLKQVYTQCDRIAELQSQGSDGEPAELSDRRGRDETGTATQHFSARWTMPIPKRS